MALAAAAAAVMVALCGLAASLPVLVAARLGSGLATGWIIPLALAFVGDVIPYERRQQVLGRFLSGQILGQLFGQAAGGVLGDHFGWRNVFFMLAALLATATLGLFYELWRNPITRAGAAPKQARRGFIADYGIVLRSPWARAVIVMAFIEFGLMFGAFTYVGADLHLRFGVSFTLVGLFVGTFAIGGLIYSLTVPVLVGRFGQSRARHGRRHAARGAFVDAGLRADRLHRAARHHGDRARLLHAAQHDADQRHADDAGGARHRGLAVLRRRFISDRPRVSPPPARRSTASRRCRCFVIAAAVLARFGIFVFARSSSARGAPRV